LKGKKSNITIRIRFLGYRRKQKNGNFAFLQKLAIDPVRLFKSIVCKIGPDFAEDKIVEDGPVLCGLEVVGTRVFSKGGI